MKKSIAKNVLILSSVYIFEGIHPMPSHTQTQTNSIHFSFPTISSGAIPHHLTWRSLSKSKNINIFKSCSYAAAPFIVNLWIPQKCVPTPSWLVGCLVCALHEAHCGPLCAALRCTHSSHYIPLSGFNCMSSLGLELLGEFGADSQRLLFITVVVVVRRLFGIEPNSNSHIGFCTPAGSTLLGSDGNALMSTLLPTNAALTAHCQVPTRKLNYFRLDA